MDNSSAVPAQSPQTSVLRELEKLWARPCLPLRDPGAGRC
ncbi:hypothetical protein FTUN_0874 [Frigoriglobus tundricola]|uniref:Uncharacterized protein n=1 Tax=Frigoriglobus tundricola TaxID=2774151 RepID=A0A6M5YHC9_9BACT|nr:hypothetical protein FTUN_0874 [Frigoriglobus tundricola]